MGVLTTSTESNERDAKYGSSQHSDSEYYSSSEETKLLQKEKESHEEKQKYPRSIFFIIGNEFCERFNYYGLRTVLTIYLTHRLFYSEDSATMIFHLFTMFAYFTPILGAIIADSWLGKFRTILFLSIVYACGGIVLSLGAFPNTISTMTLISLIGLFTISIGTGGIKPCVAAFGGDQFKEGQEKHLQRFFSFFYLSINLGSVFSTFLTPILREDVHCLGETTCFPLAFGVPAMLMIVALMLFICGKPLYTIRPPEGNIALKVTQCVCYALRRKCKSSEKKKSHWLDYADDKFDKSLIADIKTLFHVFVLYIPLPLFWALFDQQGSRWTLQATRMDGVVGNFHLKADQMQVINPLLIIAFIPLFDYVFYPLLGKCGLLKKPLQRITTGGILAAISFIIAGLIQLKIEASLPVMPSPGHSELAILNNSPCDIKIEGSELDVIKAFQSGVKKDLLLNEVTTWSFVPSGCVAQNPYNFTFNSTSEIESMMVTMEKEKLVVMKTEDNKAKSQVGRPKVRIFYNIDPIHGNVTFRLEREDDDTYYHIVTESEENVGMTKYHEFPPGRYKVIVPFNDTDDIKIPVSHDYLKSGGVYILGIYSKYEENAKVSSRYNMVQGNFLPLLLQIPQYVVITAGEIMFSITGLEFSYSQSPKSMKSVIQAVWLLTVAFGNLIVLVIAKAKLFERASHELFLFAVLMGVDMMLFAILAYFYKYVDVKIGSEPNETTTPTGRANEAYVEETDFNK